ncbi:hypothetical protein AGMMS4957_07590 [Bacteroidia bacterium]|nr:hypothetical protein AGMMS4957_07590 [Bacteroidia bacterium]
MKLSFENLGAIKKIDLDLSKKLSIFCGPNGTGKTYACYAIYGYLKCLLPGLALFELDDLLQKKSIDIELNYQELYKFRTVYFNYLNKSIKEVFGVKSPDFFSSFKSSELSTKEQYIASLRQDEFEFNYDLDGVSITYKKEKDDNHLYVTLDKSVALDKITDKTGIFHLAIITKYLCNRELLYAYMLPVERNSAYTFGNELAANSLDHLVARDQDYPSPIKDLLSKVVKLKSVKDQGANSSYQLLATEIEKNILQGAVEISKDGALQFVSTKTPDRKLPFHLAASIVKNLSGLLIYLTYHAKNNELLIIDEPEIGLHPDNQILLARIFAKLINNGIRLLISTHSDYIIRELNNLIMLSSEKDEVKEKAKEFGYAMDEKINPEDVGAYLFEYNSDKNRYVDVKRLPVDVNGFEVETIDQAISALNDRSMDLYFSLTNQETEGEDND